MLIMGSRTSRRSEAPMLGSIAHYVLHHATVPVVLVRQTVAKHVMARIPRIPQEETNRNGMGLYCSLLLEGVRSSFAACVCRRIVFVFFL